MLCDCCDACDTIISLLCTARILSCMTDHGRDQVRDNSNSAWRACGGMGVARAWSSVFRLFESGVPFLFLGVDDFSWCWYNDKVYEESSEKW